MKWLCGLTQDLWLTQEEQWLSKSHAYRLVDVDVPFSFTSPDQTAAALVNEMRKTKTEVLSHENVEQRQRFAAQINFLFWNRKEDKNMLICNPRPPRAPFPSHERMRTSTLTWSVLQNMRRMRSNGNLSKYKWLKKHICRTPWFTSMI